MPASSVATDDNEEPPGTARRHPKWSDVPDHEWDDWRWQMQHAIRTTSQLAEFFSFGTQELAALEQLEAKYKLAIPPYYFSLIDPLDPHDPIALQALPSQREQTSTAGVELDDPLEEDKDSPVPGLTHRYPDRALLVTTHVCTMYCRFCTRKRVTMDRDGWDAPSHNDARMIAYVREHREIRDVVVSGGDPLSLPPARLRWFVEELAAIDHVDVIRIGTRVPVTLPQRLFDEDLIDLLRSAGKIWIQTHFNHPREITPAAARACRNLVTAGMPVSNHAVLLKGVNDSVDTMRRLVRGLLRIKVRPYYLFHCDPVTGAGHFRTSVWKGLEIIEGLRGHVSGLAVPTYVVDGLHGAGKVPLMPNYLVSAADNTVVLRNYEGLLFRYAPEDRPETLTAGYPSIGVSSLLSGTQSALVPDGTPRLERRLEHSCACTKPKRPTSSSSAVINRPKRPTPRSTPGAGSPRPSSPNRFSVCKSLARSQRRRRNQAPASHPPRKPPRENRHHLQRTRVQRFALSPLRAGTTGVLALPDDDADEEFDAPETIAALAETLQGLGHDVELLGYGEPLLARLLAGPRPDLVWNIAEGHGRGRCREARVPAVLEMLDVPYTGSDPLTLAATLDKPCAKRIVADQGVATPAWALYEGDWAAVADRLAALAMPVFVKPAYEGSSKGIVGGSIFHDPVELRRALQQLYDAYAQPVLVEQFIDGDELTVGLVGNGPPQVLGIMRVLPRGPIAGPFVYSLEVKRDWQRLASYECPARLAPRDTEAVQRAALAAWRASGCRDVARFDFRLRGRHPLFPRGQSPAWPFARLRRSGAVGRRAGHRLSRAGHSYSGRRLPPAAARRTAERSLRRHEVTRRRPAVQRTGAGGRSPRRRFRGRRIGIGRSRRGGSRGPGTPAATTGPGRPAHLGHRGARTIGRRRRRVQPV